MSNKSKWEALSLRDRAFLMREGIRNGITDLNEIRDLYNQSHQFSGEDDGWLDKEKIIRNVPAREWGPWYMVNDEVVEGKGTKFFDAITNYFNDDQQLGQKNIDIANAAIANYEKKYPGKTTGDILEDVEFRYYLDAHNYLDHVAGLQKYLGLPYDTSRIHESKYKPKGRENTGEVFYTFDTLLDNMHPVVEDMLQSGSDKKQYMDPILNIFTAYKDRDDKGDFISIYDTWDYNPKVTGGPKLLNTIIDNATGGAPFNIYDRIYLDDHYNVPEEHKGGHYIQPIIVTPKNNKQEHKFSGEDNVPTRDAYITNRATEVINTALDKARNRTALSSPIIGYERISQDYINTAEKELNRNKSKLYQLRQELDASPNDASLNTRYKDIVAVVADQEKQFKQLNYYFKNNIARPLTGANCIWTITGDYNRPVSGNETFKVNHTQKGFKQIPVTEIKEGDIVQFANAVGSNHAMMANTPYTNNPRDMRYNGSNGADGIRINAKYPHEWKNTRAYRFVGTPEEILQWDKDYYKTYDSNDLITTDNIFLNKVDNVLQSDLSKQHIFSGEENTSNKTYLSTKPKNNIKTGNVKFDLFDFDTWRYNSAPTYSEDTDFTLSFTDALLDGEKYFKWGDNYYSTEIDYTKKFTPKNGRKPFEEFADYMYPAVIQVLQENNMPVDMAHNIVRQAAMESDYGLSPRGKSGFNLSGIKWTKTAGKSGYKYTKESDGEKYIDFKDLKEYLNYKVRTLQNNYNALNASSVYDYVEALHPKAFGKKPRSKNYKGDYSAGAANYKKSMTGMSSLDKTLMNELYFPLFGK